MQTPQSAFQVDLEEGGIGASSATSSNEEVAGSQGVDYGPLHWVWSCASPAARQGWGGGRGRDEGGDEGEQ
jgi:hypothetical protein